MSDVNIQKLLSLHSKEALEDAEQIIPLSYPDLVKLDNLAQEQGPIDPPWQVRRFGFGKISLPLPTLMVGVLVVMFVMTFNGVKGTDVLVFGIFASLGILALTALTLQYLYHRKGKCHMCGDEPYKNEDGTYNTIKVIRGKGDRPMHHSKSGYCMNCEWNTHRAQFVSDVRWARWRRITGKKPSGTGPKRWTDEDDPASPTYTKLDKNTPRDMTFVVELVEMSRDNQVQGQRIDRMLKAMKWKS